MFDLLGCVVLDADFLFLVIISVAVFTGTGDFAGNAIQLFTPF